MEQTHLCPFLSTTGSKYVPGHDKTISLKCLELKQDWRFWPSVTGVGGNDMIYLRKQIICYLKKLLWNDLKLCWDHCGLLLQKRGISATVWDSEELITKTKKVYFALETIRKRVSLYTIMLYTYTNMSHYTLLGKISTSPHKYCFI